MGCVASQGEAIGERQRFPSFPIIVQGTFTDVRIPSIIMKTVRDQKKDSDRNRQHIP